MVPTEIMCRNHLLGEHLELHIILSHLVKQRSIKGWIEHNCLEPSALKTRHEQLVREMISREYKHKSPLLIPKNLLSYLPKEHRRHKVQIASSLRDLLGRCGACRSNYNKGGVPNAINCGTLFVEDPK